MRSTGRLSENQDRVHYKRLTGNRGVSDSQCRASSEQDPLARRSDEQLGTPIVASAASLLRGRDAHGGRLSPDEGLSDPTLTDLSSAGFGDAAFEAVAHRARPRQFQTARPPRTMQPAVTQPGSSSSGARDGETPVAAGATASAAWLPVARPVGPYVHRNLVPASDLASMSSTDTFGTSTTAGMPIRSRAETFSSVSSTAQSLQIETFTTLPTFQSLPSVADPYEVDSDPGLPPALAEDGDPESSLYPTTPTAPRTSRPGRPAKFTG